MHAAIVPPLTRSLSALSHLLEVAEAFCADRKIDPAVLLGDRLAPDMFTLTRQVQLACDFAARAASRLAGQEVPSFPDTETTTEQLRRRIAAVQAHLAGFDAAAFDDAAARKITIKVAGQDMSFDGQSFYSSYALPQFYFHMTTAYNILRHNGVRIGKRDFMGAA